MGASIVGLGHEVPPPAAVGDVRRPLVTEATGASDLALAATQPAFAEAGWTADSVEIIVFATMSPDVTFPGSGCFLQDKLGAGTVGALDVRGQCAGYLLGLMIAGDLIESGKYDRVLLAAAEVHSSSMDPSDAGLEIRRLYGDGAAATALSRDSGVAELRAIECGADGRHHQRFWCEFPASRRYPQRLLVEDYRAGKHYLKIDRDHVAAFGRDKLPEAIGSTLAAARRKADEVDLFVLSHVFPEVAEDAARSLGVPDDRLVIAGREHGHLSAASLPIALDEARAIGRIDSGARVCIATCGAGYAWGAALLEFA
jgi:3-oxoacyl-[acyl-carrier-protein] synthase-3